MKKRSFFFIKREEKKKKQISFVLQLLDLTHSLYTFTSYWKR